MKPRLVPRMVRVRMMADVAEYEGKKPDEPGLRAGEELDISLEQARGWISLNKALIILPPDTVKGKTPIAKRDGQARQAG